MSSIRCAWLTLAEAAVAVIVIFINPSHSGLIWSQKWHSRAVRGGAKCLSDPGNSLPRSGPLLHKAKWRDKTQWSSVTQWHPVNLCHSMASWYTQDLRAMNKRYKQQKTPRGSLRLTVQRALLLTLVLGQPTFFFPESSFFSHRSSLCLPLLPAPFLLPGKQKFLKSREKVRGLHRLGQEPPGLLPARSLQWAAAHPRETQIKSPPDPRAFFPLRKGCVWSREHIYVLKEISSNLLRTQSASKGPTQAHLLQLSGADLAWIRINYKVTWLVINPFFVLSFLLLPPCPTQDFLAMANQAYNLIKFCFFKDETEGNYAQGPSNVAEYISTPRSVCLNLCYQVWVCPWLRWQAGHLHCRTPSMTAAFLSRKGNTPEFPEIWGR